MGIKKSSLVWLATASLFLSGKQSSVAFEIVFPPQSIQDSVFVKYKEKQDKYYGYSWLQVPEALDRNSPQMTGLLTLLNEFSASHGNNWDFELAENDLDGSFNLNLYYACGLETACGNRIIDSPPKGVVGGALSLQYNRQGNDFQILDPLDLYWIQRVRSNHDVSEEETTNNERHGFIENVLDINPGQTTPYYNRAQDFFQDAPNRIDPQNDHTWDAELYLAQETRIPGTLKRKVTIYNGINWGWKNETFGRVRICDVSFGQDKIGQDTDCLRADNALDLVIVIDTTGSMSSYIDVVKNTASQIIDSVFSQMPDSRIAVVDYKDFPIEPYGGPLDYPYRVNWPFSRNKTDIINAINGLVIGGGGDIPESALSALTIQIFLLLQNRNQFLNRI